MPTRRSIGRPRHARIAPAEPIAPSPASAIPEEAAAALDAVVAGVSQPVAAPSLRSATRCTRWA